MSGFFDMITNPPPRVGAPELTDADRDIATLADHPGFVALRAQLDEHERAWGERIARQITSGGKPFDVEKAKLEYTRGYFAGAKNLVGRVAAAKAMVDAEEA